MILNNHFGNALKKYLKTNKLSQVQLSNLLGVSKASVTTYLKTKSPHKETLDNILRVLNITEEDLYGVNKVEEEPVEYHPSVNLNGMVVMSQEEYKILILEKQELQAKLLKYMEKENEELKAERTQGESPNHKTSTLRP